MLSLGYKKPHLVSGVTKLNEINKILTFVRSVFCEFID